MSFQVRVVKRPKAGVLTRVAAPGHTKNEQQRNREIVAVVKSWIDEFKLRTPSRSEAALVFLKK
jgi:hypothetical protein